MNNEPVAWMVTDRNTGVGYLQFEKPTRMDEVARKYSPLYTHPADLTDEEIWEVINRTAWVGTEEEIRFKIAEAILRKAQEK